MADERAYECKRFCVRVRGIAHPRIAEQIQHPRVAVAGPALFQHKDAFILFSECRADVHRDLVPDDDFADAVARVASEELPDEVKVAHAAE